MMRIEDDHLSHFIIEKYSRIENMLHIRPWASRIDREPAEAAAISAKVYKRRQVENRKQPLEIEDALEQCKVQLMVRDNHKPELFIWCVELSQVEAEFGFVRRTIKNRLTKPEKNISFYRASDRFYDYFAEKVSVPDAEISTFSKSEI